MWAPIVVYFCVDFHRHNNIRYYPVPNPNLNPLLTKTLKSKFNPQTGLKMSSLCSYNAEFGPQYVARSRTHRDKYTPADQYMASMDVCCNFSFLLSAVLLCTNSSSLLFSMSPNGLSLDAASFLVFLVQLRLTMFSVYCFFWLCLYLFYSCLLYFSVHMTYQSYLISMIKEKDTIDEIIYFTN